MKLNKLINNQGLDGSYCEKVLGSTPRVDTIATAYLANAAEWQLIATNAILEYIEGDVSKDEFTAFKAGVGAYGAFMQACLQEKQDRGNKQKDDEDM